MRVVTAVALTGLLLVGGCTKAKPKPNPNPPPGGTGVILAIASAKPEYAAGEPVVLRITLTNAEPAQCRVNRVPEGTLAFVGLTRDGNAVMPGLGVGSYIDGMAAYLRSNLVPLAPGASLSGELRSDRSTAMGKRYVLETSTLDTLDEAAMAYWPVDAPGKYSLSARYVAPTMPDGPHDVCRSSGDAVQVAFTVLGG